MPDEMQCISPDFNTITFVLRRHGDFVPERRLARGQYAIYYHHEICDTVGMPKCADILSKIASFDCGIIFRWLINSAAFYIESKSMMSQPR